MSRRPLAHLTVALVALAGCGAGAGPGAPATCEALLAAPPALATARLTVDGARFRDALGREVLLRGVNAGGRAKLPPFFAFPFAESGVAAQAGAPAFDVAVGRYLDRVAAWGLDVIRLPFTWEAAEPTRVALLQRGHGVRSAGCSSGFSLASRRTDAPA